MGKVIEFREGSKVDLEVNSIRLGEIRGLKKTLTAEESEIKDAFLKYFEKADTKYFNDGTGFNVIDCQVISYDLDQVNLADMVGPEAWAEMTDVVVTKTITLNADKFRAAISAGIVTEDMVKDCTTKKISHRLLRNKVKKDETVETETVNDNVKSLIEGLTG